MRAWELYETGGGGDTGSGRKPIVSLRHINQLKRLKAARRADEEQRQRLWSLMYADPNTEQHSLDEREVELDGREQELRLRELQAEIGESIAKAEVSQQRKDDLYQMAMREIGRRRKKAGATSS
ncbi:hypothetical protein [Defluviicoccus vanus]|uniref:Uncharacterized protein n=1 Tax=Defluviicoccus vanus TaxID=111831 RepID=A0A7H1MZG3_9PROT|nr:hypothetical protein [Defluviicoccus vanus]QNT68849.1 hypothetical protein HQ394_05125 [Defluviicoccus vanus]